jgi:hypothetical protein
MGYRTISKMVIKLTGGGHVPPSPLPSHALVKTYKFLHETSNIIHYKQQIEVCEHFDHSDINSR